MFSVISQTKLMYGDETVVFISVMKPWYLYKGVEQVAHVKEEKMKAYFFVEILRLLYM